LDQPQNPSHPDAITERSDIPPAAPVHPADGLPGDWLKVNGPSDVPPAVPSPPTDTPPLGPIEWLKVNGPFLLLIAAGIVWLGVRTGPAGLWKGFLVVVGIGLVIFVHELGHFLVAKWCDVHVTTFSIGFGPAIPGCSFRRGETLYKIALLPLGGYVNMVGEGPEADEDESYPRSFKNKTVGQRMLIISAGVIMNVLLGCICYIIVYRFAGEPRLPAIIGSVQPGTPAWKAGVHSAMRIEEIDGVKAPYWDNLKMDVASAPAGRVIPFVFETRDHQQLNVDLMPRKEPTDKNPVIGVAFANRLQLAMARQMWHEDAPPVYPQTPAEAARVMEPPPDEFFRDASVAGKTKSDVMKLPTNPNEALAKLSQVMRNPALTSEPLELISTNGNHLTLPPGGFTWEDEIIATSDPDANDLREIKPLPPDPFPDPSIGKETPDLSVPGNDRRDIFEYQDRMKRLAGKPVFIQVRRKVSEHETKVVTLLVPPAYHQTLGMRMTFGKVSAIREGSPAQKAGVQEGDQLTKVTLTTSAGVKEFKTGEVDPAKLPTLLAEAAKSKVKSVVLTVVHPDKRNEEKQLQPVGWDDSLDFSEEQPVVPQSPLSIPQLGLAYLIQSTVAAVTPESPAALAGAAPGDTVVKIRFRKLAEKKGESEAWGEWIDLKNKARYDPGEAYEQWAYIDLSLQSRHEVQMKVNGAEGREVYLPGRSPELPHESMTAATDTTWPQEERGLIFQGDAWRQKTDSTVTALVYGVKRTGEFIQQIMLNLRAIVTGRVSTDGIGGPLQIAAAAFAAAEDPFMLLLFLGVISVNLAVVNFLPIPVLDGGHMVFLIYEKLRGRRPSETVQNVATIGGIVFLLSLMLFITYQDAGAFGLFQWVKNVWPGK
jgi:membrane-associated protease RseP (regulator of RpoE activity)